MEWKDDGTVTILEEILLGRVPMPNASTKVDEEKTNNESATNDIIVDTNDCFVLLYIIC
jgi:hypothetical protein